MNILAWLTGSVIEKFTGPLERAWQAKLAADTDEKKIDAERAIKSLEGQRDIAVAEAADRWSAVRIGRWLIVVPFGLWWAAIYIVQILNPWFGWSLVVIDVPEKVHDMAVILIPAIVIGDSLALVRRKL